MRLLQEHLTFDAARIVVEGDDKGKNLFMKGICIQGGVKNANQRVYPVSEISKAVTNFWWLFSPWGSRSPRRFKN